MEIYCDDIATAIVLAIGAAAIVSAAIATLASAI